MSDLQKKQQETKNETVQSEAHQLEGPLTTLSQTSATVRRATLDHSRLTPRDVLLLQRTVGNRATARLLGRGDSRSPIQAKMSVGPADDRYEREADQIANHVQLTPMPKAGKAKDAPDVQTAPLIGRIQRRAPVGLEGGPVDGKLEATIRRAQNGGSSLSSNMRSNLEPKLGADLSKVRVHTDHHAVQLNRDLGAKAFTYKNHIFYGAGQSPTNVRLTAHEAVHTIQQGAVPQTQRKSWTTLPGASADGPQRIQRASGLPTKKEAEKDGGKPGFKMFGKTTWKKFLNALDDYNKLKESDNVGKAKTLARLQALTIGWLESASRAKVKTGDAKKKEYLAQLRPTIKLLYYKATTKSQVVAPARLNAELHAEENRELALGHLESYLKEAGIEDQVDDTDALLTRILNRLMSAKLTKNVPPGVVTFLTASPDFKTCWQLANRKDSPGGVLSDDWDQLKGYSQQREKAERLIGYSPFTEEQRENRPDYVGVNITNNPRGAAGNYGRWFFEFKDSVKSRITFTARDTFSHVKDLKNVAREKQIGVMDHMESTLAYNAGAVKVLVSQELDMGKSEPEIIKMMPFYIEGQVHGGLSVHDIETVVVDLPSKREAVQQMDQADYDALQTFLQKYPGIRVRYRG